jgi:hypothetical protein
MRTERHVTAVWVGPDGDEVVLATMPDQRKLRNLRRDPRIALSVPSTTTNRLGLLEYLVVYGIARVTEGGAAEMLQHLAHTYISPDTVFPNMPDLSPRVRHEDHARAVRRRRAMEPAGRLGNRSTAGLGQRPYMVVSSAVARVTPAASTASTEKTYR